MEVLNLSYSDIMSMSVFDRKFLIGLKRRKFEKEEEKNEKGGKTKNGGKTMISGETLKNAISNNEIRGL